MDLLTYEFEEPSYSLRTDRALLEEAKSRGFYCSNTSYNRLFSKLFFKGGSLKFKKDLDGDFKNRAIPYLKAFMSSWMPKHEEKEAISALILSELVDIEE